MKGKSKKSALPRKVIGAKSDLATDTRTPAQLVIAVLQELKKVGESAKVRITPNDFEIDVHSADPPVVLVIPRAESTAEEIRQTAADTWAGLVADFGVETALEVAHPEILRHLGTLGESKTPGYTRGDMDTTAAAFAVAARRLTDRQLKGFIQRGEVAAAVLRERETTTRATVEPRRMTQAEIRRGKLQARLDGLQLKYEERLEALELPPEGFTTKKQAAAAATLATNLRDIQKLQVKLGFLVTEWPDRVSEAESMASAYRRSHDKETGEPIPPRARGRPRRTWQQASSSP